MSELQQTLSGLMTAGLLVLFIGICIWSWSSKRKEGFDRMARIPLDDEHSPFPQSKHTEQREASL